MLFCRCQGFATLPHFVRALLAVPILVLTARPAAGQEKAHPSLLSWMGLEQGDTMAFETSDGGQTCVTVGSPRWMGDRAFAPLFGLAWPGLASDSRILVPLDGTLDFFVDRTPGPRPSAESLLEPGGWRAGANWSSAESLVYRWCETCMDAGTTIVLEKGGGIRSISRQSIVGPTTLTRIEGGCAEREEVELELYVEPAPARDP